jgi:hypothetical protein
MTSLLQFDKITVLLQLVDKLATSLLRTHLVDKLCDMTSLLQFDKITVLLQLVDKLVTSLLRTHLVDKL